MTVGVLDGRGLVRLFRQLEGRRFLGVVDCDGCVELVFDESRPDANLVSIFTDAGRRTGLVALGFVTDAERYARECRELEDAA